MRTVILGSGGFISGVVQKKSEKLNVSILPDDYLFFPHIKNRDALDQSLPKC